MTSKETPIKLSKNIDFLPKNDIIISRYNDIICNRRTSVLDCTNKANRTRQVQFRMDPEKVKLLLSAIALDDNMHSMADLFNKAADEYLKKQKEEKENG